MREGPPEDGGMRGASVTRVEVERDIRLTLDRLPETFDTYVQWRFNQTTAILGAGDRAPALTLAYLQEMDDRTVTDEELRVGVPRRWLSWT